MTTVITGGGPGEVGGEDAAARQDKAAAAIEGFEGMALDDEARCEIMAALEACAARERALEDAYADPKVDAFEASLEDPGEVYMPISPTARPWHGTLEPPVIMEEVELDGEEAHWSQLGREKPEWLVEWQKSGAGDKTNISKSDPTASD